jgi:hypothetical protein
MIGFASFCDPETGRDSVTGQARSPPSQCDRGLTCLFHKYLQG